MGYFIQIREHHEPPIHELFFSLFEESSLYFQIITTNCIHPFFQPCIKILLQKSSPTLGSITTMFQRLSSIRVVNKNIIRKSLYKARSSSLVCLRRFVWHSRSLPQILATTSRFFQPCLKIFFRELSHIRVNNYHVQIVQHSICQQNHHGGVSEYDKQLFFSLFEEGGLNFQIVTTNFSHYISVLPTMHKDLLQRVQPHLGPLLPRS